MENLSQREIDIIQIVADRAITQTLIALGIKAKEYRKWITQNQAKTIYGVGVKKLKTAILNKEVRVKDPNRVDRWSRLLVDRNDVIKVSNS